MYARFLHVRPTPAPPPAEHVTFRPSPSLHRAGHLTLRLAGPCQPADLTDRPDRPFLCRPFLYLGGMPHSIILENNHVATCSLEVGKDRGSGTCGGLRVGVLTGRGRGTGIETRIPLGGM